MFSTLSSFLPSALQNNDAKGPPPHPDEHLKQTDIDPDEMGVRQKQKREKHSNEASLAFADPCEPS